MQKRRIFTGFLILSLAGLVFFASQNGENFISKWLGFNSGTGAENQLPAAQEAKKQIFLPPPLRAEEESTQAFLTRSGIIGQTNIRRTGAGLSALKENPQLNAVAETKARDMLQKQYFAHVSPSGVGVDGLAQTAKYEYIAIGENLALGNFESDKILVQAWMNSEGHRENILSKSFTEIGVAAVEGIYEGRKTWLAVQEFGRPLSDCPQPSGAAKAQIDGNAYRLDQLSRELENERAVLDDIKPKRGAEYERKVDEYNARVEQYNNLLSQDKAIIEQYNQQVAAFNECASR